MATHKSTTTVSSTKIPVATVAGVPTTKTVVPVSGAQAKVTAVTRVGVPNSIRIAVVLAVMLALIAVIIAFLWPIYFTRQQENIGVTGVVPIIPVPVNPQWRIVNVTGVLTTPFVPTNQEIYVLDPAVSGTFTIGSPGSTPTIGKTFIINNGLRNTNINIAAGPGVTLTTPSRSIPTGQAGWFVWLDNGGRVQQLLVQNQPR